MNNPLAATSATSTEACLNYSEAAAYLRTSERTLRRLVHDENVTHVRFGGQVRFRRKDLDSYIERCAVYGRKSDQE